MAGTQKDSKSQVRPQSANRLGRLSMDGLSIDDALKGAMDVPAPDDAKPKKRKVKRKAAKKRKK